MEKTKLKEKNRELESDEEIEEKIRELEADPEIAEKIRAFKAEPSLAVAFRRSIANYGRTTAGNRPFTPELEEALEISRSRVFTRKNWIRLNVLAEADERIGDLLENFIMFCEDPKIWDPLTPEELAQNGLSDEDENE